jgi:hypothetical protein
MTTALVVAGRSGRVQAVPRRLPERVYRRRRALVGSLLVGSVALAGVAVSAVVAGPGGVPASAAGAAPTVARVTVVAQPGDTLWSLARRHHGPIDVDRYLDALIAANGGTAIQAGQAVQLP